MTIKKEHFPYLVQGGEISVSKIELYAVENKELVPAAVTGLNLDELTTALETGNEFVISLTNDEVPNKEAETFLAISYTLAIEEE